MTIILYRATVVEGAGPGLPKEQCRGGHSTVLKCVPVTATCHFHPSLGPLGVYIMFGYGDLFHLWIT